MSEIQKKTPSRLNFFQKWEQMFGAQNKLAWGITFHFKESGSDVGESGGSVKGISLKKAEKWATWYTEAWGCGFFPWKARFLTWKSEGSVWKM